MGPGAAIRSDEPYLLNLRKGTRAAVVVPLLLAFCLYVLDNPGVALFAVFAATAALVFADYGGPPRQRAGAYVTMLVVGAAMVLLGAGLAVKPIAAVAGMFVVAFGLTLASSLGGYAPQHVAPLALAYSLSVLEPLSQVELLDRMAGWGLGCVAALVGAVGLWPVVARTGLRDNAAALAEGLAEVLDEPGRDREGATSRLRELSAELHRSASTPMRPAGPAAHDIALFNTVVHLQQATHLVITAVEDPEDTEIDHLGGPELRGCVASALRHSGAVIRRSEKPTSAVVPNRLVTALLEERSRARKVVTSVEPADRAVGLLGRTVASRALAHLCIWIELDAARSVGCESPLGVAPVAEDGPIPRATGSPDSALAVLAPELAVPSPADDAGSRLDRTRRLLQRELGYRSVVAKNSLRAGVALSAAVLLAEVLGVEHGFWVVLATLLVLRSNAYNTSANALSAVLGTLVGFALSVGFVEMAGDHHFVLWIVFTAAVFLSGYTPGTFGTAAGQGSFALLVVMLLTITDAPGLPTAVARVEDVLLGAATAVVLSLVIWPRGARALVASTVASAFRAAAGATSVFVECPPDTTAAASERISSTRRAAENVLDAAMTEHGGQVMLGAWMAVLRVVETARALTFGLVPRVGFRDPDEGPRADDACTTAIEEVEAAAGRLGGRLDRIADALDSADPAALLPATDGTAGRERADLTGALSACVTARRGATGDGGTVDDAVFLVAWAWFIEQMELELDAVSPEVLELVATADPHRWLKGSRR